MGLEMHCEGCASQPCEGKKWDGEQGADLPATPRLRSKLAPGTPVEQQKGTEVREVAYSLILPFSGKSAQVIIFSPFLLSYLIRQDFHGAQCV